MSERKKKDNAYSTLTEVVGLFKGIKSSAGKINAGLSIVILLIIFSYVIAPVFYYIVYGIYLICNTVLANNGINILTLDLTAPSARIILVCILLGIGEAFACTIFVSYHEQKRENLNVGKKPPK